MGIMGSALDQLKELAPGAILAVIIGKLVFDYVRERGKGTKDSPSGESRYQEDSCRHFKSMEKIAGESRDAIKLMSDRQSEDPPRKHTEKLVELEECMGKIEQGLGRLVGQNEKHFSKLCSIHEGIMLLVKNGKK